jgi:predicted ferric reductase
VIWGVVAQIFVIFIFIFSLSPIIKLTGYQLFRKTQYVVAVLFIGVFWGHWSNLACFMIASLFIWFVDRGIRLVLSALLHYNYLQEGSVGFTAANANMTYFQDAQNGDVVRLDFAHPQDAWHVGQHFFLCFPEISVWQSHPFTSANLSRSDSTSQQHSYTIRAKRGETKNLATLAQKRFYNDSPNTSTAISVILTDPYTANIVSHLTFDTNVVCVAGGTGITYILPILLYLTEQQPLQCSSKMEFTWAVRRGSDTQWIDHELQRLHEASKKMDLAIRIYVTRESAE